MLHDKLVSMTDNRELMGNIVGRTPEMVRMRLPYEFITKTDTFQQFVQMGQDLNSVFKLYNKETLISFVRVTSYNGVLYPSKGNKAKEAYIVVSLVEASNLEVIRVLEQKNEQA